MSKKKKSSGLLFVSLAIPVFIVAYFTFPDIFSVSYEVKSTENTDNSDSEDAEDFKEEKFVATHIKTPEPVKGIYMTSWVAGTPSLRSNIIRLISETEINSVVIDIKDDTGRVSYEVSDPELQKIGSEEVRIRDLRELIALLHRADVYVIGRIAVFQDPYMVRTRPELSVKRSSDGAVWRDRKGLTWIDPGAKEHWNYISLLAKDSYEQGFDEIQFDYIRFPSDGNMWDIAYPFSEGKIKSEVMKEFFAFLSKELRPLGIPISADLFGMTTTNKDDLNIGQVLEHSFPYFDYVSPMVYPSHYPTGFYGHSNVNAVPYEIVKVSMDKAMERLKVYHDTVASTTVQFRPWLQDNDYPVHYTAEMVRAQIRATNDSGISSWLLWDAANTYTRGALLDK